MISILVICMLDSFILNQDYILKIWNLQMGIYNLYYNLIMIGVGKDYLKKDLKAVLILLKIMIILKLDQFQLSKQK